MFTMFTCLPFSCSECSYLMELITRFFSDINIFVIQKLIIIYSNVHKSYILTLYDIFSFKEICFYCTECVYNYNTHMKLHTGERLFIGYAYVSTIHYLIDIIILHSRLIFLFLPIWMEAFAIVPWKVSSLSRSKSHGPYMYMLNIKPYYADKKLTLPLRIFENLNHTGERRIYIWLLYILICLSMFAECRYRYNLKYYIKIVKVHTGINLFLGTYYIEIIFINPVYTCVILKPLTLLIYSIKRL